MSHEHEEGFVRAFVRAERQERIRQLLATARGRVKFRGLLGHFLRYLRPECLVPLPPACRSAAAVAAELRRRGAGATGCFLAELSQFEAPDKALDEGLAELFGRDIGYLVSCRPGELGLYEGERGEGAYVLVQPAAADRSLP